ncbi:hypothetical protein FRB90_011214 [Tulasnella sp. 427]|nr:hypothetical protein FRB90_011214 [Tulasnella sp. 427]
MQSRHPECLGKNLRKNIRKLHKTPADLPGYQNLKALDKTRAKNVIWPAEEDSSLLTNQDTSTQTGAPGGDRVQSTEPKIDVSGSSVQHIDDSVLSEFWYTSGPSWDDPAPSRAPQVNSGTSKEKGQEPSNYQRQATRRNVEQVIPLPPIPSAARAPLPPSEPERPNQPTILPKPGYQSKQTNNSESQSPNPRTTFTSQEAVGLGASAGPPAPPKADILVDSTMLMRLELEDKEAEVRLVEAELQLAETRVKVETARRAVVAQKLVMARAGVSPTTI